MKPKTSVQPPPPPHSRLKPDAAPESEDSTAGGVLLIVSLFAGIASIILGTMSLVLWLGFSQWIVLSMPLALLAIVLANSVLVVWWFLGSIDIRIHIIGLTLGVVGVLGWFARSGEIQEIIAGVRIAQKGEKTQESELKVGQNPNSDVSNDLPANDDNASAVVATHETASNTILFIGLANEDFTSGSHPYFTALYRQETAPWKLKQAVPEWFEDPGERPEFVIKLDKGAKVRSLKAKNITTNEVCLAHFVEVVSGPRKGTRGWIADKELVRF